MLGSEARRHRKLMREFDKLDRKLAREARQQATDRFSDRGARAPRAPGRGGVRSRLVAVAVLLVCLAVPAATAHWGFGPSLVAPAAQDAGAPPAGMDENPSRMRPVVVAPAGTGGYAFEQTMADGTPVTWDPCRAIHVVTAGTPPRGMEHAVAAAVAELSAATGLVFVDEGPTSERASSTQRLLYQPDRYGKRWAPLLVDGSDPRAEPDLAGDIIGLGGGDGLTMGGRTTYVTGKVSLDSPQMAAELERRPSSAGLMQAVVLHELGHALGLAHVSDPAEVMYPEARISVTDLGPGDRRGLAALGAGRCAPGL